MWRRNVDHVLPWICLICLLTLLTRGATGLRGSAVVLQAKAKAAELKEAGIEVAEAASETEEATVNGTSTNSTVPLKSKPALTGIPQKDYIFDPNLPRELNGHNLTDYPFYNAVPEEIDFNCDGLHDGFYASVTHKCQLYHHCLFGTRYDFLCANYTAFDQKTFICHFVSEVDCQNSPKYYKRNEALYKAATTSAPSTTTPKPTTSTTAAPATPPPPPPLARNRGNAGGQRPFRGQRRPYRRRRPVVYEYYYDGDDYDGDGDYYYDDEPPERQQPRRKGNRKHQRPFHGQGFRDDDRDAERPCCEPQAQQQSTSTEAIKPSVRPSSQSPLSGSSVYDRPRVPPKIRRPVPINERDKYEYTQQTTDVGPAPTAESSKNKKTQGRKPQTNDDDEYYDDEEEDDYAEDQQPKYKKTKTPDYEVDPAIASDSRRPVSSRHRLRVQSHRRPDRFEDDYEEEYDRFRTRKESRNNEDYSQRSSRFRNRGKLHSRDEEAVPAERPGYISGGRAGSSNRKRPQNDNQRPSGRKNQERRPIYEDDDYEEYYDNEDEEDDKLLRRNHRTRQNGRREEEYADDPKSGKRQNNKGNGSNAGSKYTPTSRGSESTRAENNEGNESKTGSKYTPTSRGSESTRAENNEKSKVNSNPNSKFSSNNDDPPSREPSQNKDTRRTSLNKSSGVDNQKVSSTTTEKYISDEEYDDEDYEEPRQTSSTTKSVDGKYNNRKEISSRPSQTQSNGNRNSNEQNKNEKFSSTLQSSEEPPSTTALNNQESLYSYNRSPGLFRSRTSPLITQSQTVTTPMTLNHRFSSTQADDNQDYEDSEANSRFKIDTRGKTVSTTPSSYYRKQSVIPTMGGDRSDETIKDLKQLKNSGAVSEIPPGSPTKEITETPAFSIPSRSAAPSVMYRRPSKSTSSNTIETTTSYSDTPTFSSQRPVAAIGYRRVVKPSDSDEKYVRKEQTFPPTGYSGNYRRPSKGPDSDRLPQSTPEPTTDDSSRKSTQQPVISTPSVVGNGQYRKIVKPSFESSTQENAFNIKTSYEDVNKPSKLSPLPPLTFNYRRPATISKPVVEDYPSEYDDAQKDIKVKQPAPALSYRRPLKTQKLQESQPAADNAPGFIETSDVPSQPSGPGNLYQKPIEFPTKNEGSTIINLKSHYGFFNSNRPKQNGADSPTAPESVPYNTRLIENGNSEKTLSFPRQPPRNYDSTAPGPSGPEEGSNRNSYRQNQFNEAQNPSSNFDLNIPEEEYDVTLNDALQPSTLHPTRSLADYPLQGRLKARVYQSRVTHPSRGTSSYLLPSASQQYIARVQTTRSQEKAAESERSQNKDSQTSADQEYEAVVLSAPQYDTGSLHRWVSQQRQLRPTEWYW